jgi:hypothetical protein
MTRHDSIRVSQKYGVNPAIPVCFFCNEKKNEIMLAGRLKGDVEAPKDAVWDRRPCDKCIDYMKEGIILISVRDGEQGNDNPYRTGGWCVVREEMIGRISNSPAFTDRVLKMRMAFMEDAVWEKIGLPRGEAKEAGGAEGGGEQ